MGGGENHAGNARQGAVAFLRAFADYAGWRGVGAALLVGASAIVDGASILLLIPILGVVVPGGESAWRGWLDGPLAAVGAETVLQRLGVLLVTFLLIALLRAALLYTRDMVLARLQGGFVERLRNRTLHTLANAPWSAIVTLRHARITNLLGTEMQRVAGSAQFLIQATVSAVLLIVQILLAFSLEPVFATVAMLLLGIGAVVVVAGQGRSRDMGGDVLRQSQAMMGSASGFLGGLKAAAAQNDQGLFTREFSAIQVLLRDRQLVFQRRQARSRAVFALVSALAGTSVIFGGVAWGIAPPVLIALILLFARMSGPAQQIQSATQNFHYGLPSFEGIRNLERELQHDDVAPPDPAPPPPGPVSLHAVHYQHPGGGGVKRADFSIAPGTFVGISGPSGAGKTTLVDILIGLLPPQEGEMRIGGVSVDGALLAGWRQGIAYVPQDGFLFHDSVRRNLSWDGSADDAAIARATALSGADVVIARLERGLDTVIGERGAILSGGERQRIALARALLRSPRLLVLDEAANAIDAAGEAALLARLAALEPRPTILMISHRAESMALCDRVIRVELGVVSAD